MRINFNNKLATIFLVFTLLSLILSCNLNNKDINPDHSLETIRERGKLVAITGYNAYSYFIYKGRIMGYEYELLERFAEKLGVDVEIKLYRNIEEMFRALEDGEGDVIAFNLTITNERKKYVDFSNYINTTQQVLVQQKPKNWRKLTLDKINNSLIRNPINLENKTVYVRNGSAYQTRLENLAEEIGGYINIVVATDSLSTEDLIKQVAEGEIDYTISDENIAHLNQAYFPNIDIDTHISFQQKIGWAVKKGSDELLVELNEWADEFKTQLDYHVIYERYYKYRSYYKTRRSSKYFLNETGGISKYDEIIKKYANTSIWDWRLLAAIIYEESRFEPEAKSWANAVGLMQLLPTTGMAKDSVNLLDPEENIKAGVKYLSWLDEFWGKEIKDNSERTNFVLASYNIGFGHIEDARRLAIKYSSNPNIWENNVETFLLKKANSKYYNDDIVKNGYCRGIETVDYVKNVIQRYESYSQFVN